LDDATIMRHAGVASVDAAIVSRCAGLVVAAVDAVNAVVVAARGRLQHQSAASDDAARDEPRRDDCALRMHGASL